MPFTKLFEPIKIGLVEINNRIVMAPMGPIGLVTERGGFSRRTIEYYVRRAKGGVGLIITGLTRVENEIERVREGVDLCIARDPGHFIRTASELTERIHAYGTKIFLQITAGFGRVVHPQMLVSRPIAPCHIPNYWNTSITCRELSTEEVEKLVEMAAEAAYVAREADFDGVEVHAVHEGYLLDQFAIAFFNKRTDKYGGDLKGRLRFAIEIVKAVQKRCGQNFPVSLRFSMKSYIKDWNQGALPGEDFVEKGRDVHEALAAARILEEAGYDAFNVDAGSYEAWYWAHPPTYQEHGLNLPLSEQIKRVVRAPVIVAGKMGIPELAERALMEGKADMVALGRALLADPEWPNKVKQGRTEDIRPCIGCHNGCLGRGFAGRAISCAVNPSCGREIDYDVTSAKKIKHVLIIGGGVAGMEAARLAAIRGHKVTLCEKMGELGGHLIEASVGKIKEDIARLLKWYRTQIEKLGIDVRLNTEVTPQFIEQTMPEVVIIATGSEHVVPDVPGIEKSFVVTAEDALLRRKDVGSRVVVLGGGLVGCETAVILAMENKQVTIMEALPELMVAGIPVPHMNRAMLLDMLKFYKVKVLTNTSLLEVRDGEIGVINCNFRRYTLPVDTVVIAVGLKPKHNLYYKITGKVSEVYVIGDALKPRNIMYAIWDAYEVVRSL